MDFWKGKMLGGALVGIFDFVNSLPQADIAAAANLTRARDGKSFACPDCGNGLNGGKGDGLVYRERGKSGRSELVVSGLPKKFLECGRDSDGGRNKLARRIGAAAIGIVPFRGKKK